MATCSDKWPRAKYEVGVNACSIFEKWEPKLDDYGFMQQNEVHTTMWSDLRRRISDATGSLDEVEVCYEKILSLRFLLCHSSSLIGEGFSKHSWHILKTLSVISPCLLALDKFITTLEMSDEESRQVEIEMQTLNVLGCRIS